MKFFFKQFKNNGLLELRFNHQIAPCFGRISTNTLQTSVKDTFTYSEKNKVTNLGILSSLNVLISGSL